MSSFEDRLDQAGKALRELAHTAQEKILDAVEVGSRKVDLLALRRSAQRETQALGEVALDLMRRGQAGALGDQPRAREAAQKLDELEAEIRRLEAEIENARAKETRKS